MAAHYLENDQADSSLFSFGSLIFNRRTAPGTSEGLFISYRSPGGKWGEPRQLDLGPLSAGQGMVSPDGKYLFFTAGERLKGDIYWVDASILKQ